MSIEKAIKKEESRCTSLMAYDLDTLTANCYDGTTCLINKFDIRDSAMLAGIEAAITFAKAAELEHSPIEGSFDFEHYKSVHRYLFKDIYDWAGTIRVVDISKKTQSLSWRKISKRSQITVSHA